MGKVFGDSLISDEKDTNRMGLTSRSDMILARFFEFSIQSLHEKISGTVLSSWNHCLPFVLVQHAV
jgi:hypothetical protein